MNRRQKMKRMKQELAWYKKQMNPVIEVGEPYVIRPLYANVELVGSGNEEIVHKMLANRLTDAVSTYMEVEIPKIYTHPIAGEVWRYRASIKIAIQKGKSYGKF